jgi:hypothetical protein
VSQWPRTGKQLGELIVKESRHFADLVKASGFVPEHA